MKAQPNVARLNELMDRDGLDALVVRSGENFTYLTGIVYPGTLGRHLDLTGSVRSPVLIWPRNGKPEIVLNDFALGYSHLVSDMALVEYLGYREQPYSKVAERLSAGGFQRIGIEFNYCPKRDFDILSTAIPPAHFVDCWFMLDEVRWIKTASEVALLKEAADLLDDVYLEVLPTIKPGETERAVHARMMRGCVEKGFSWTHGILNSHRNEVMYNGESDFQIAPGDLIRTDYVAYLAGYPGHQSRNVVVGEPSVEMADTYQKVREVYSLLMERIRPGVVVGELYDGVVDEFRKRGLTYSSLLIGHSVGPWFHQQEPILRRGSSFELAEGMVLALEPYYGSYHIQDMVQVTASTCRLLSAKIATDELWVV
jgi:Xaa-Pro aminopeptidase